MSEKGSGEGRWLSLAGAGNAPAKPPGSPGGKAMHPCSREKHSATSVPAVPKPTQVGGYKDTKARERNLVKELGNIAP